MTDKSDPEEIRKVVAALSRQQKQKPPKQKMPIAENTDGDQDADIPMEVAHAILGNDIYKVIERDGDAESDHSDPVEIGIDALRRAEAILFATTIPIAAGELVEMLPPGVDVADILMQLQKTYAGRGIQLMEIAGGGVFKLRLISHFCLKKHEKKKKSSQKLLWRPCLSSLIVSRAHALKLRMFAAWRCPKARWMYCWKWIGSSYADDEKRPGDQSYMAQLMPSLNILELMDWILFPDARR